MASTRLRASAAVAAALLLATAACGWAQEQEPPAAVGPAEDTGTPAPPDEGSPEQEPPGATTSDTEAPGGEAPDGESPDGTAPGTGTPDEEAPTASEGEPSPSRSPTTATPTPEYEAAPEAAAEYMDALAATDEPDRMREGWLLTPEGSTADAFLTHRISVAQARADEGRPLTAAEVRPTAQGFELCDPGDKDADPPQERQCAHFTGFESEGDRIEDFLVDGADPGPGLFGAGERSASSEGVHASLVSAYHAQDLEMTVDVSTVHPVDIDLLGAVYVDPDGEEHDVASAAGRYELGAGSTTRAAFRVVDAEPGGVLRIEGCREECSATVELEVPVG
ncbi:hypothetical protein [Nocardiopsis sp. NRRL B-16309]|uniref:hypothetical protein n=1 Tax=Nocardiopsis sp. NRRL B-16309 TaxID=1519494 RepID=UPI0006AE037C|nr:hypothetical protein [Nocardiopsis sp. NRRL B-16309]